MPRIAALSFALALVSACAAPPPEEEQAARSFKPHTMNVLVGGSFDRAGDGPAIGANYEHGLSPKVGVGAFGDVAFGGDASTILGGGVFVHPWERWTLLAGPGVEFVEGDADVIARIGGWYAFPMDKYTISPTAWIDFGNGTAFFLGVSFGFDL